MDIRTLLPRSHVLLDLAATDRRSAFEKLVSPLVADAIVADADRFLDALERREEQITTQVEAGIAFPHARSGAVRRLALTVGIGEPAGIDFGGGGTQPVRLLFLIAVPSFAPTAHLPLLQRLANFAHQPERVTRLLACNTQNKVVSCLTRFKG